MCNIPTALQTSLKTILTSKTVEWCAKDIRPFDVIKDHDFKELGQNLIKIGATHGNIKIGDILVNPTTISRNVEKACIELKEKLIPELSEVLQKEMCAATTDMWTDDYRKNSYLTFTVHYFSEEWELKKRILFTALFEKEKKTGENIRNQTVKQFKKFGLKKEWFQKLTIVTDQGANVVKAFEQQNRLNW